MSASSADLPQIKRAEENAAEKEQEFLHKVQALMATSMTTDEMVDKLLDDESEADGEEKGEEELSYISFPSFPNDGPSTPRRRHNTTTPPSPPPPERVFTPRTARQMRNQVPEPAEAAPAEGFLPWLFVISILMMFFGGVGYCLLSYFGL